MNNIKLDDIKKFLVSSIMQINADYMLISIKRKNTRFVELVFLIVLVCGNSEFYFIQKMSLIINICSNIIINDRMLMNFKFFFYLMLSIYNRATHFLY